MSGLKVSVQLYRLERYTECRSVYTDLIRNSQDEYEEERKTNLAAVVASVSQWESAPAVSLTPDPCSCSVSAAPPPSDGALKHPLGFYCVYIGSSRRFWTSPGRPMSCATMLPAL